VDRHDRRARGAPRAPAGGSGSGWQPALRSRWCGRRSAVAALAQGLRYWSILSLGRAWNARAVVDPDLGFVESGPYRWIRHPNYLAVLLEFLAVPIVFGAWRSWILSKSFICR